MHLPLIHISTTTLWQLPILQLLYEHLHLVEAPVIQFVTEFYDGSLTLFPINASGVINAGIHDLTGCESIVAFASRRNSLQRYVLDCGLYLPLLGGFVCCTSL